MAPGKLSHQIGVFSVPTVSRTVYKVFCKNLRSIVTLEDFTNRRSEETFTNNYDIWERGSLVGGRVAMGRHRRRRRSEVGRPAEEWDFDRGGRKACIP